MSSLLPPVVSDSANKVFYPDVNDVVMATPSQTYSSSETKEESQAVQVTDTRHLSVTELDMDFLVDMSSYLDTPLQSSTDEAAEWPSLSDQFTFAHALQLYQPEWLIDAQSSEADFHFDLPPCDIGLGQFDFPEPPYFVRTPFLQHAFEPLPDEVVETTDNIPSAPPPTPNSESDFSSVSTFSPPPDWVRRSKRTRKTRVIWTPDVTVSPSKRKAESSSLGLSAKKPKLEVEAVSAKHSCLKSIPRVVRPCRPGVRSSPRKKAAPKPVIA